MANSHILTRLNSIEAELAAVRRRLQDREQPRSARESLFGILEGEEFTEEEIDAIIAGTFRDVDGKDCRLCARHAHGPRDSMTAS